jgi:hypothetical protein
MGKYFRVIECRRRFLNASDFNSIRVSTKGNAWICGRWNRFKTNMQRNNFAVFHSIVFLACIL